MNKGTLHRIIKYCLVVKIYLGTFKDSMSALQKVDLICDIEHFLNKTC